MQLGYLELKLSWAVFNKAPDTLDGPEQEQLLTLVQRQNLLEQRILASTEAAHVVVPDATRNNRFDEIKARYSGHEDFVHDLARSGLNEDSLSEAIARDLRMEAVLDKVAADTPAATETDAEIYYRLHPKAFDQPETRQLRHILLTFSSPAERISAEACLVDLCHQNLSAEAFGQAALRHSQCPTAMDGGKLGTVKRGQLYAELEPAAFVLNENEVSTVLTSPIGLHIIRCDAIEPGGMMPFETVCQRIIEKLTDERKAAAQRSWIKSLRPTHVTTTTVG